MSRWSYPQDFDAGQAVSYANFCQQAYFQYYILNNIPPDFGYPQFQDILKLPPSGYQLLYNIYDDSDYFGYVANSTTDPSQIVIALRGTEGWLEWSDDFLLSSQQSSPITGCPGLVHEGFAILYEGLEYFKPPKGDSALLPIVLTGAKSVMVTGHSLGAALGTLLVLDIALNIAPKINCTVSSYNFASPMVGDPNFAGFFNQLVLKNAITANFRVANGMDVVPNLPPNVFYPPGSSQECDYMQVDEYCPVDSGILSILSDAHSLSNYVIGLENIANAESARPIEHPASAMRGIPRGRTEGRRV